MREKIKLGWDFEKTYQHLVVLDDFQKINKGGDPITLNTTHKNGE